MRGPRSFAASLAFSFLVVAAPSAPAHAQDDRGAAGRPQRTDNHGTVQDLAYGEVLFYFYQDDHFDALTRLLAGLERNELPHHAHDADLLLGALYLSYGQHRIAGEIFEQVLEQSVDPAVHDRAWFFLAKIWHQRGYLEESEAALNRIQGELPGELEPERQLLHAQVLMEQRRFDEALARLEAWKRPRDKWVGYARYNIGVALVRLGRVEEGARVLAELGQAEPENAELGALRDKANVALGYAWLQANRPAEAKPSLQRVRLTGPYSNKALLGVGWSDAEQGDYRAALAPWVELRGRNLLDSAVQESLLAVPYAFTQLGADKQAADYYVDAIAGFNTEIRRLDAAIDAVENGRLIDELLAREGTTGSGWFWRLDEIPETAESRYLYELMASNAFQEGLKGYRDLLFLNRNLDQWAASLGAFDDILDTRQRAYEQRLPVIETSLERIDLDALAQRRVALESRLLEIEKTDDAVALGTPEQQELWQRLSGMEPKLALLSNDARAEALRYKQRFLKGLLLWDLRRDYNARLWNERKSLRDLDLGLKEARRRHYEVAKARDDWPEQFAALTRRIAALSPRVAGLQTAATAALAEQKDYLQGLAVNELKAQRDRLETYIVQARFALASIYDRAAAQNTGAQPPRVPTGGGAAVPAAAAPPDRSRSDAVLAEERR